MIFTIITSMAVLSVSAFLYAIKPKPVTVKTRARRQL